jgi:hypothetical protein
VAIATPAPLGHHVIGLLDISSFVRVDGSAYGIYTITVGLPAVVRKGGTQVQNSPIEHGLVATTEIRKAVVFLLDECRRVIRSHAKLLTVPLLTIHHVIGERFSSFGIKYEWSIYTRICTLDFL